MTPAVRPLTRKRKHAVGKKNRDSLQPAAATPNVKETQRMVESIDVLLEM